MENILKKIRLPLFVLGFSLFFLGERYFETSGSLIYFRIIALASAGLSVLATWFLSVKAQSMGHSSEAVCWRFTLLWSGMLIGSMISFLFYAELLGSRSHPESPWEKILLGFWVLTGICGVTSAIGFEWGIKSNGTGPRAETARVKSAGLMWLSVGMLLCFLVGLNFFAAKKNIVDDWSYLKTTRPSEFTQNMLGTANGPLNIGIFYPKNNEVLPYVREYFENVKRLDDRVTLSYFDQELDPGPASEYKANQNGLVVVRYDGKDEKIRIGTTINSARKLLKNMDEEFQKIFLKLNSKNKIAYFTEGHGELSWRTGDPNSGRVISTLHSFLSKQNFTIRKFGVAEGSTTGVPEDASVLVVVGPTRPFMAEEVRSLKAYVEGGGSLLVFLDVELPMEEDTAFDPLAPRPLLAFLEEAGIKYHNQILANDTPQGYVVATQSPLDKTFLYTNLFTSHESVSSLARHDEKVAVLTFRGGWFSLDYQTDHWHTMETMTSMRTTFADLNENYSFDKDSEVQQSYVIGAAALHKPKDEASGKKGRIIAISDATIVSDGLIRNTGNLLFAADAIKWLVQDDVVTGQQVSEEDIKIRHSKEENLVWFYGSVIFVPGMVLVVGGIANRRKRKKIG